MELNDLRGAQFVRRLNRFVAQVRLEDGKLVQAHLANTGRMSELLVNGAACLIRPAGGTSRKTAWDLLFIDHQGRWVCLAAVMANDLVAGWLERGLIDAFGRVTGWRREVKRGSSRFDFALDTEAGLRLVEVKSVNLVVAGRANFPDAPTVRGLHHVQQLTEIAASGGLAGVVFVTMGQDVEGLSFNKDSDPAFAQAMLQARQAGVVIAAYAAHFDPPQIVFEGKRQILWE
jgi:sugar fermentation stimulation protein A